MSTYYNLTDIQNQLKKEIDLKESFLKSWLDVKFCTKKDGTAYKNMKQNFINASYYKNNDNYDYVLTVFTDSTELNGYDDDSIRCYLNTYYDKNNPVIKNKPENIIKTPYHYDIYVMDIDDIKTAVNDHIEYLKNEIAELKSQLKNSEKIYTEFKNDFAAIMEKLNDNCNSLNINHENDNIKFYHNRLYCMVKDTIINRYPYC